MTASVRTADAVRMQSHARRYDSARLASDVAHLRAWLAAHPNTRADAFDARIARSRVERLVRT